MGRPNIGQAEVLRDRFSRILDSNWLTNNGPMVQQFEAEFAQMCGTSNCVMIANGTLALELAIRALELRGEVILPSFTFVATAHALSWHGITPVFCDVDPNTLCIDPIQAASLVTARTSAILGVHLYGRACDVAELTKIAQSHDIHLVFDAAHAAGCTYRGRRIGAFGDCEVFSFHATKILNSIEGGAITTNDAHLAERLRRLRNFGFPGDGSDTTVELGINAKMNEFCAAMGLTNLESMDQFIQTNKANYDAYQIGLSGIPGIELMRFDCQEASNYHYVILRVDKSRFGHDQLALMEALNGIGVRARRYFSPGCHAMEPYSSLYPDARERLPVTEAISHQVVALPTGTQLGKREIGDICDFVRGFQAKT